MKEEDRRAELDLYVMLDALKRDARDVLFGMGEMRARKELANGTVVTVKITNPSRQPGEEPEPAEACDDVVDPRGELGENPCRSTALSILRAFGHARPFVLPLEVDATERWVEQRAETRAEGRYDLAYRNGFLDARSQAVLACRGVSSTHKGLAGAVLCEDAIGVITTPELSGPDSVLERQVDRRVAAFIRMLRVDLGCTYARIGELWECAFDGEQFGSCVGDSGRALCDRAARAIGQDPQDKLWTGEEDPPQPDPVDANNTKEVG